MREKKHEKHHLSLISHRLHPGEGECEGAKCTQGETTASFARKTSASIILKLMLHQKHQIFCDVLQCQSLVHMDVLAVLLVHSSLLLCNGECLTWSRVIFQFQESKDRIVPFSQLSLQLILLHMTRIPIFLQEMKLC